MRPFSFLLLAAWLPSAIACSMATFNSTYEEYPDCAATCLGCEDGTYSRNFANNCDYVSGECCTSKYHNVINETWACVRVNCNQTLSEQAFVTFTDYCQGENRTLKAEDVPKGYSLSTSSGSDASGNGRPPLSLATMIGIGLGGVTCIATIVGVVFKCYRHRKNKSQGGMPYQAPPFYPPAPAQQMHPGQSGLLTVHVNYNEAPGYNANGGYKNGGMAM